MKIYNKIILQWNNKTQSYDDVVYEDSFEYEGELMLAVMDKDDLDIANQIVQGDKMISIEIVGDFSPSQDIKLRLENWNKVLDS